MIITSFHFAYTTLHLNYITPKVHYTTLTHYTTPLPPHLLEEAIRLEELGVRGAVGDVLDGLWWRGDGE
jgi:hypothetical protein